MLNGQTLASTWRDIINLTDPEKMYSSSHYFYVSPFSHTSGVTISGIPKTFILTLVKVLLALFLNSVPTYTVARVVLYPH